MLPPWLNTVMKDITDIFFFIKQQIRDMSSIHLDRNSSIIAVFMATF